MLRLVHVAGIHRAIDVAMADQLVQIANIGQCADENAVVVKNLKFSFPTSGNIVEDFSLTLPKGSRALLCGANGAGKTTLLQILGGKYMVGEDCVRILGRPAFHDLQLVSSGDLSYLGPQWRRDIAFAGNNIPMQVCTRVLLGCLGKVSYMNV